ncbi:heparin lyase I family protein [Termitidicoccus mucosus]
MNIKTTLLCALFALAPFARATLYYHIDGESGGVITTGSAKYTATGTVAASGYTQGDYWLPTFTLTQTNGVNCVEQNTLNKFGFVVNPDGDYDAPVIASGTGAIAPFKGGGYLQFGYPAFQHPNGSGRSSPPGNKNAQNQSMDAADKVMIAFAPHYNGFGNQHDWNPAAVQRRDIGRYVGFALYIPAVDTMPVENSRWTILYQAFQLGTGGRPPFAITITRARTGQSAPQGANTVEISFGFRDSDDANSPQQTASDDLQSTTYFRTVTLKRGVWYSFVIWQKPSSDPNIGRARAWLAEGGLPSFSSPKLNDYLVLDFAGKWGYPNPQTPGGATNPDRDLFSGQLGLYSNDIASKPARVLFDEIKFADTYDEANPIAVPASRKPVASAFNGGESSPNLVVAGQTVQITGSNFAAPAEVWFDATPAASVTINSASSITAVVPAGAAFTGQLSVHCSGWAAAAPQAYRFASAPEELLLLNDTQTVAAGHSLSLAAAAIISDLPINEFTWQYSTDNGQTWLNAVGSNYTTSGSGAILHINNTDTALNNYRYRYLAASAAGIAYSNSLKLAVSTPPFQQPVALAFDTAGALHVADASARLVLSATSGHGTLGPINGTLTLAGATSLVSAEREVALSGSGVLRLAGLAADALYKLTLAAGGTAAAAAPETAAQATAPLAANPALTVAALLSGTVGITATDTGNNFYYTNPDDHTIRIRAAGGETLVLAGTPGVAGLSDGTGTNNTLFDTPFAIILAPDGSALYVADTGNALIRKITFPTASFADARVSTLHVTATSADITPPPPPADSNNNSGGGGGAPGLYFLAALAVLATLRRFR